MPAKVSAIEYDPERSARLALLLYVDGEKRYILAPAGLQQGDTVVSGAGAGHPARATRCRWAGAARHHGAQRRAYVGKGGQMVRAAGSSAQVVAKEGERWRPPAPSAEMRMVHARCLATIGEVGNSEHELRSVGQGRQEPLAGQAAAACAASRRTRWTTRWAVVKASRPADARRSARGASPKGAKTRHPKKASTKLIVRGRRAARPRSKAEETDPWRVSIKKGPYVEESLLLKVQIMNTQEREEGVEDLGRGEHDRARVRGPHVRGAQRQQVRAGVRDREHGGAQAGRVRADADLPRPQRQARGRQEGKPE